jgi:hypothetical protein
VGWWVAVLVALDAAVLVGVLVRVRSRRTDEPPGAADALALPRPSGLRGRERQVLTIEILDPSEVAASRGRALGLVGALAPGIVRRVVYERTRRIVIDQLAAQGVRADVRLHTLRPAAAGRPPSDVVEVVPVDAPPPLDL